MDKDEALKLALDLAIMHHTDDGYSELRQKVRHAIKQALAAQRQWVGLTLDERYECANGGAQDKWDASEATEAKLKEKNNG